MVFLIFESVLEINHTGKTKIMQFVTTTYVCTLYSLGIFLHIHVCIYMVFRKYRPIERLRNFSGVRIFYKSATTQRKG